MSQVRTDRHGNPYPANPTAPAFELDGFTFQLVAIANAGDREDYPATLVLRRAPNDLTDNERYYTIPFSATVLPEQEKLDALFMSDLAVSPLMDILRTPEGVVPPLDEQRRMFGVVPTRLIDSIWQHKSGAFYRIMHIANHENTSALPLTVVYYNVTTDEVYAGRADDWERRMTNITYGGQLSSEPTPTHSIQVQREDNKYIYPPRLVIARTNGTEVTEPVDPKYRPTLKFVLSKLLTQTGMY
jgi:hypothetical protein